jgi:hypothetical protein
MDNPSRYPNPENLKHVDNILLEGFKFSERLALNFDYILKSTGFKKENDDTIYYRRPGHRGNLANITDCDGKEKKLLSILQSKT